MSFGDASERPGEAFVHDLARIERSLRARDPELCVDGKDLSLSRFVLSLKGLSDGVFRLARILSEYLSDLGESEGFYMALATQLFSDRENPSSPVREEFASIRAGGPQMMIHHLRRRNGELPGWTQGDLGAEHIRDPDHIRTVTAQYARMLDFFEETKGNEAGVARIAGALRYFLEGRDNTYDSDATFYEALARRLTRELPHGNRRMLDLGCGNAAKKLTQWDRLVGNAGRASLGIDGSSTFALRGTSDTRNIAVGSIDAETDELRRQVGEVLNDQFGIVLANLVLDRVADPAQLIRNMNEFLAPGGKAVLGCLLPNTGEDDEDLPADQKIVYTPKDKRVSDGKHPYVDAQQIKEFIERELGVKVKVTRQPYRWKSSGGEGVYDKHFIFEWTKSVDEKQG